MTATVDLGVLSPTQRDALHPGPQDALPFDPRALVLYGHCGKDPKAGFAAGALDQIDIDPCRLMLELAAGAGCVRSLTEASGSFGGIKAPMNVAVTAGGDVYLVDRASGLVKYFDPCDCIFKPLPCFSPKSPIPQQQPIHHFVPLNRLNDPMGIAILGTQLLI